MPKPLGEILLHHKHLIYNTNLFTYLDKLTYLFIFLEWNIQTKPRPPSWLTATRTLLWPSSWWMKPPEWSSRLIRYSFEPHCLTFTCLTPLVFIKQKWSEEQLWSLEHPGFCKQEGDKTNMDHHHVTSHNEEAPLLKNQQLCFKLFKLVHAHTHARIWYRCPFSTLTLSSVFSLSHFFLSIFLPFFFSLPKLTHFVY